MDVDKSLPALLDMERAIDTCGDFSELCKTRTQAAGLATMARSQSRELEYKCTRIRLRAERRIGEILIELATRSHRGGDRKSMSNDTTLISLKELGITRDQSSDWQKIASIPRDEFDQLLGDEEEMPSTASLVRYADEKAAEAAAAHDDDETADDADDAGSGGDADDGAADDETENEEDEDETDTDEEKVKPEKKRAKRATGRTRKPKVTPKPESPLRDRAVLAVRAKILAGEPINKLKLADELGISHATIDVAVGVAHAWVELTNELGLDDTLADKSARERLAIYKRRVDVAAEREQIKWQAAFDERVRVELRSVADETVLPSYHRELRELRELVAALRKGMFTAKEYRDLRACLHPDRAPLDDPAMQRRYQHLFQRISSLEKALVKPEEAPLPPSRVPRTYEEMMKAREEQRAYRASRRRGGERPNLRVV